MTPPVSTPRGHRPDSAHSDPSSFAYAQPARSVRFGPGALGEIDQVLNELGCTRALTVATHSQHQTEQRVAELLGDGLVATSPVAAGTAAASEAVRRTRADVLIALGGGSALGVVKAVAAEMSLPIIAVPTTYSGSEMTSFYGVTENGRKHARHDVRAASRVILYDPELTLSLSPALTAGSGTNALAQAVGSLFTRHTNAVSIALAAEGIRRLAAVLPSCAAHPDDLALRSETLLAAHLCGGALGIAGLSAHHELVHAVGDRTHLPHASLHAALLPQTTGWACAHHTGVAAKLCTVLDTDDPPGTLHALLEHMGIPRGLGELGLARHDFEATVTDLLADPPTSWRTPDRTELDALLTRAYHGTRPPGPTPR